MTTTKAVKVSLLPDHVPGEAFAKASRFREDLFDCLTVRGDELFELVDALLCADGPMSAANDAAAAVTGRKLVLSLCEWGTGNPWNWGAGTAPMWRTSTDVIFWGNSPSTANMLAGFDKALHPSSQHTGYYNDPDMLMVGMNGFTAAQNRTHMGLWAISGAPLLAGNNLATMSSTTAAILKNSEVIAIDQDARGLQGVKVAEDTKGLQVYSKVLSGTGKRAVLLLNRTSSAASITARWADLGLTTASASVRDVWTATNAGSSATSHTTSVPAGEAVLLTISGTEWTLSPFLVAASSGFSEEALSDETSEAAAGDEDRRVGVSQPPSSVSSSSLWAIRQKATATVAR